MGQILTVYPEQPALIQSVKLGAVQYRLRLTWRDRTAAWYSDLYTVDGAAIWLGQRVSTRWVQAFGLEPEGNPDGVLYVRGPFEYQRQNLGESVDLVFYPSSEVPAFVDTAAAITVTIPS